MRVLLLAALWRTPRCLRNVYEIPPFSNIHTFIYNTYCTSQQYTLAWIMTSRVSIVINSALHGNITRLTQQQDTSRLAFPTVFGGVNSHIYSPVTRICTIMWQTRLRVYMYNCIVGPRRILPLRCIAVTLLDTETPRTPSLLVEEDIFENYWIRKENVR